MKEESWFLHFIPEQLGEWQCHLLRDGENQGTSKFSWRRKWQPIPVFLPGESQGQGSLVGYRLWGRAKSDTTEVT